MRFQENGPAIPDDLLVARDEGQVLFFCGAGVSSAKARLPGFLELANRVLKELRALPDSPARRLTEIAAELQKKTIQGVGGIVAADRIFGLLERDFDLGDIEWAVGRGLQPQEYAVLDAHRIMLELSKGPSGRAQLITTNFDLLFEKADPSLSKWTPSQLPDLRRNPRFEGIVHLHGMLDSDYRRAKGGRLVLSSAEFGRAYLAEGWATDFIRTAIEGYRIVFVGYTADDPPVQYLLEALSRGKVAGGRRTQRLYAFQGGDASEAAALWRQKGVTAITYSRANSHADLWETLGAWAERARNPESWRVRLLKQAQGGPARMKMHERGQVAHLAATNDGARALAEAKRPLPSEWLCVFDPTIRFGTPEYFTSAVDPFIRYGIDSDPEPPKNWKGDSFQDRKTPEEAVDVLAPLPLDGYIGYIGGLRGTRSDEFADVPPRLVSLAGWFMRVCGEPSAMWWAAGQSALHAAMLRNVRFALDDKSIKFTPLVRTVWRYLFEFWRCATENDSVAAYTLNQRILKEGWTPAIRRAVADHLQPELKADRPRGPIPPANKRKLQQSEILSLSVRYPDEQIAIEIPDSEVGSMLPLLRRNLEDAWALEKELHPNREHLNIPPIESDPNLPGEPSERRWGLNLQILRFARFFQRLLEQDRVGALQEFWTWPHNGGPIFGRLRVWAAGLPDLLDPESAGRVLTGASDRVFWGQSDQRDLLLVIARRWNELSRKDRKQIETRLRKGIPNKRVWNRATYLRAESDHPVSCS